MALMFTTTDRIRRVLMLDGWHDVAAKTLTVTPSGILFREPDGRRIVVHREDVHGVEETAVDDEVVIELHR